MSGQMKSVAIGKIGKAISFDSNRWGAIGGDNEAPIFYENMFHKNPDITFYLIGVSDYSRLNYNEKARINKHGNVIDVWENFVEWRKSFGGDERSDRISYMTHWMKTAPKIDVGLFFMGPTATSNVYGKVYKVTDPTKLSTPLAMQCKYAAPVIDYINESNIAYNIILNDPRFYPGQVKDLFNPPRQVLSQFNEEINHRSWVSYNDMTTIYKKINAEYKSMETIFLIGKEKGQAIVEVNSSLDDFFSNETSNNSDKSIKFMIVCNQGRPSRYNDLKKYILDNVETVDIYGKWDDDIIENDERFKGPRKFNDLQKMLPKVKYTFCIPIKKGWVTAKFWEMIHYGIIPFLHPTYDEQNNLKCPEFLRVKDSADLFKKIEFLENNQNAYDILRKNLDEMLLKEYYDGSYLNDLAMISLKEITNE
jgi:hypothetical protein